MRISMNSYLRMASLAAALVQAVPENSSAAVRLLRGFFNLTFDENKNIVDWNGNNAQERGGIFHDHDLL